MKFSWNLGETFSFDWSDVEKKKANLKQTSDCTDMESVGV